MRNCAANDVAEEDGGRRVVDSLLRKVEGGLDGSDSRSSMDITMSSDGVVSGKAEQMQRRRIVMRGRRGVIFRLYLTGAERERPGPVQAARH